MITSIESELVGCSRADYFPVISKGKSAWADAKAPSDAITGDGMTRFSRRARSRIIGGNQFEIQANYKSTPGGSLCHSMMVKRELGVPLSNVVGCKGTPRCPGHGQPGSCVPNPERPPPGRTGTRNGRSSLAIPDDLEFPRCPGIPEDTPWTNSGCLGTAARTTGPVCV